MGPATFLTTAASSVFCSSERRRKALRRHQNVRVGHDDVELRVAVAVLALIVPMPAHRLGFVECHGNKRDQSCGRHW